MNTKQLRQKILDLAIRGKLVPQDPNDEPASVLLERIRAEKERLIKEKKIKAEKKKSGAKSHYEKEVPFEVPESWEWCLVKSIGFVVTGSTPSKDKKEYYGGTIPFYKPTDLDQGINTKKSIDKLSNLGFNQARKLSINSVLVTCIGATIGKTGLIKTEGSCNQQINAITPYVELILPKFLYYFCISDFFQNKILINASATTLPIINKGNFEKLNIPLPPLAEQHRIVSEIERLFKLVDTVEESKLSLAQFIAQTKSKVLDLAIRGKLVEQNSEDEPASVLLEQIRKKHKSSKTTTDKFPYPFEIPGSWRWCKFLDLYLLISGRDLAKDEFNDTGLGIPYLIGASSFNNNQFEINRWTNSPQVVSEKGDLLITCKGTIGDLIVNDIGDVHIARQFMAIRSTRITESKFTECFFQYSISAIKERAKGVIPGIARKDILDIIIPLPPLAEQKRIVSQIGNIFSQLDIIEEALKA